MKTAKRKIKEYGRYVVSDPMICHGAVTFRGTRIFVRDVLAQVAEGMPWDEIVRQWRGSVTKAAIAEAVLLASRALTDEKRRSRKPAA